MEGEGVSEKTLNEYGHFGYNIRELTFPYIQARNYCDTKVTLAIASRDNYNFLVHFSLSGAVSFFTKRRPSFLEAKSLFPRVYVT